jgi:NitT/TauT family transport system substrate-binding protein
MRLLLTGAVAGALLLGGCSRPPPPVEAAPAAAPLPKIRFQNDWFPQPEQGGIYQAAARGFYRAAGLDVEIRPGGPGRPMITGLLAGQDDIEIAESVDVITRVGSGIPLVMIGAVMEHDPLAVIVHADDPVRTLADLDGRTVMAIPGTTWLAYVKARYGINFNLIPLNFSLAQFMADPRFIQQCFITSEPYFAQQQGAKVRAILISESGYDPYRVYVTTRKFARDHPAELRAFLAASIHGWDDFGHGDPTPARQQILALNSQMTPAFLDYSVGAIARYQLISGDPAHGDRTGLLTTRRLQAQIDLLFGMKAIPEKLSVDQVADFEFLPADLQDLARR